MYESGHPVVSPSPFLWPLFLHLLLPADSCFVTGKKSLPGRKVGKLKEEEEGGGGRLASSLFSQISGTIDELNGTHPLATVEELVTFSAIPICD